MAWGERRRAEESRGEQRGEERGEDTQEAETEEEEGPHGARFGSVRPGSAHPSARAWVRGCVPR